MIFSYLQDERRRNLLAKPFPDEWLSYLQKIVLYRLLSEEEKTRLQNLMKVFVAEKFWEGCAGLPMTEEIKVTIAGQACLLLLGFENYYLDEVKTILVYPGGYLGLDPYHENDLVRMRRGEAHHKGPVILSWWDARRNGRRLGSSNLVLHEFAHKLAELGDPSEGIPPIDDPDLLARWKEVAETEYERLAADARYDRPTLLDDYGATDKAEFFAVTTECFFLHPLELRREHAGLYRVFAEWYRQDPAERRALSAEDLLQAGDADDYEEHLLAECTKAIRLRPDYVEAYRHRADLYYQRGEFDKAIADYTAVVRLSSDDAEAEAYCDRGVAWTAQDCYEQALADFDNALLVCPSYARAYLDRGATRSRMGHVDAALADLNKAIQLDPKDDAAYIERGLVYLDQEKYDQALHDLTKAIRLFPCSEAYGHRACAYLGKEEHDRAIADCTEAIRLDPGNEEAYRTRAEAYAAKGDEINAQRDRAEAEKLAGDSNSSS